MIFRCAILFVVALLISTRAEIITSQSSQFIVHGQRAMFAETVPEGSIVAQPDFLAITAERVRSALVSELPALRSANRPVYINLLESGSTTTPIGIASTKYSDGWTYQMAIPPIVDEVRLVKAFIEVLMIQFANAAPGRDVELPHWAVEGMAQQLFFSVGPKLVVDNNSVGWQITVKDIQHRTREALRTNSAPTFQELTISLPPPPKSAPENLYQSSTHLLVKSLLEMPNGRVRFAAFLQFLPQTWNWQTAFRQAFGFERMLDVEKWWALTSLEFSTRDQRQAWPLDLSARKLDEILNTRVEVRSAPETLPESKQVDLNAGLREENWTLQRNALEEKISQLTLIAPHLAPEVGALALGYKRTIEAYVEKRERSGLKSGLRSTPEAQKQIAISDAARHFQELDGKRRALVPPTLTSAQ